MSDSYCTCPAGRPLGAPHLEGCPEHEAQVIVMRQPHTGRPVAIPGDIVTQVDRTYAAYECRLKGWSWQKIATEGPGGGWPSAAAAQAEVTRYLEEGRSTLSNWKQQQQRDLWRDRLEMLWEAAIEEASAGKVPSMMAALSIAKTAMTLERLDQPSEEDTNVPTVVVPSEEYIKQLQQQAEAG